MTDVFLSYSREDAEEAGRFAVMLERAGLSVWWDSQIPPGKTWDQVIGQALDEAKCVVVLWTERSVASDWVKEEASRGARRGVLVPVRLDAASPPLGFGRIEAAELAQWDGDPANREFQNFVAAVQDLVEKPLEVLPQPPGKTPSGRSRRALVGGGGVAVLLILAGVAGWRLWMPDAESAWVLDAEIRQIAHDREGSITAAETFSTTDPQGDAGSALDALASRVVAWVGAEVVPAGTARPVEVHLAIPEDPRRDGIRIRSRPEIALTTFVYTTSQGGKLRSPNQLRPGDIQFGPGEEFFIEVAATGYESRSVPVVVGETQDRAFDLAPLRVKLAVEEFGGTESRFAARLTALLSKNERLEVFGPEALAEFRRDLERSQAELAENPWVQTALRDDLGVDYILRGRLTGARR